MKEFLKNALTLFVIIFITGCNFKSKHELIQEQKLLVENQKKANKERQKQYKADSLDRRQGFASTAGETSYYYLVDYRGYIIEHDSLSFEGFDGFIRADSIFYMYEYFQTSSAYKTFLFDKHGNYLKSVPYKVDSVDAQGIMYTKKETLEKI